MSHVRVLHFGPHLERCGIAKYQEMFLEAMRDDPRGTNEFFDTSPNKLRSLSRAGKQQVYQALRLQLAEFDVLHIQHEFSYLYSDDFPVIIQIAKELRKKIVVTAHTSPRSVYQKPRLTGLGPRSYLDYLQQLRRMRFFYQTFRAPIKKVDLVLCHNSSTGSALQDIGVSPNHIQQIALPVPVLDHRPASQLVRGPFANAGDIVIAMVGFILSNKGIDHAINALNFLPPNYKLVVIGGVHPDHDSSTYNQIADLINQQKLWERVQVTGYIEDDQLLNAIVRESDLCIFPYARDHYSNNSSASINNAFANHKPVIVYPTEIFLELNRFADAMVVCQSNAYYELAREIRRIDLGEYAKRSKKFAEEYSYSKVAIQLMGLYAELVEDRHGE